MGISLLSSLDPSKVKGTMYVAKYTNYFIKLEYHFIFNRNVEFKKICVFIFRTILLVIMKFYVRGLF